jgi:hypothetical protein
VSALIAEARAAAVRSADDVDNVSSDGIGVLGVSTKREGEEIDVTFTKKRARKEPAGACEGMDMQMDDLRSKTPMDSVTEGIEATGEATSDMPIIPSHVHPDRVGFRVPAWTPRPSCNSYTTPASTNHAPVARMRQLYD